MRETLVAIQLLSAMCALGVRAQPLAPDAPSVDGALADALEPEPSDEGPIDDEEHERAVGAELESWLRAHGDDRPAPPPDPFLRERARAMARRFAPSAAEALAEHLERNPGGALVDELRRHAAPRPQPMLRDFVPEEMQAGEQSSLLNAAAPWVRAVVHTTVRRDGTLVDARIVSSSGVPAVDREALRRAREDAELADAPARLFAGADRIVLGWAFEMADVATNLGSVGCVADIADLIAGEVQCAIAGHGYVRTRVIPLGVVDLNP